MKTKTQIASTPVLKGKDAQCLLDSLNHNATENSKNNGKKLMDWLNEHAGADVDKMMRFGDEVEIEKSRVYFEKETLKVRSSLEQSLKEMKLMREGKIPKKSWWELRDIIQDSIKEKDLSKDDLDKWLREYKEGKW